MAAKRLVRLVALLCLAVSAIAQSPSYPRIKGVVSDYAGKLDQAQISELSSLIKNYERQTSIEFVVVVTDSLDGESVGEYAKAIGNTWKIGKNERNNGIVLLWAPNERAYSLRIADGLTPDLNDADAKKITDENLLPNFKQEEYYTGLKQTVLAAMAHLGNEDWNARLQTRLEQETIDRKRRAEETLRAEEDQKAFVQNTRIGIGFLLVLVIGTLGVALRYRARRRKDKLAEMAQAPAAIANNLAVTEKNAPEMQRVLDDFAKETPEQDISKFRVSLAAQPERILKIKTDAQSLNFTNMASYDEVIRIRTNSESETKLLESTKQSIAKIREAKIKSQALMEQLSRERFEIDQIRDPSRQAEINQLLLNSRQGYYQARQNSSMSVMDWIMINNLLNNSHNQVQQAVQYSQEAPYVFSSSSSSVFSGSDSSASSGGGGGGFSSGSGSDGSY
jgi:uncharacterized membrane protein YgcG